MPAVTCIDSCCDEYCDHCETELYDECDCCRECEEPAYCCECCTECGLPSFDCECDDDFYDDDDVVDCELIYNYSYTPNLRFMRTSEEEEQQTRYMRKVHGATGLMHNRVFGRHQSNDDSSGLHPTSTTTPLHMGVELEVSFGQDAGRTDLIRHAREVHRKSDSLVYLKEDASIEGYGFEVVTHPFTWAWAKDNFPIDYVGYLEREGAIPHESCGMHVHLDRRAFTRTHLFKFLAFHYHDDNVAWLVDKAGRDSDWGSFHQYRLNEDSKRLIDQAKGPGWDERVLRWENHRRERIANDAWEEMEAIARRYGDSITPSIRVHPNFIFTEWSSGRGVAVNTGNPDTLELRYWAPPTTADEFMKRLEFIDALYNWTKRDCGTAKQVKENPDRLRWEAFTEWVQSNNDYRGLPGYLHGIGHLYSNDEPDETDEPDGESESIASLF